MSPIKIVMLIAAATVVGGLGATIYATDKVVQLAEPILEKTGVVDREKIETFAQDAQGEIQTISSRGQDVASHTQQVLGTSVEVNENDTSIQNRAFEYGRYLYCQQVVEEYEGR